jgi:hypothetical protein
MKKKEFSSIILLSSEWEGIWYGFFNIAKELTIKIAENSQDFS